MSQSLSLIALVVRDYDEAIAYYTQVLGFDLVEDTDQPEQQKRWVVVRPRGGGNLGAGQTGILLARASTDHQDAYIGNQSGGRVFLFLQTDDFWRDYRLYKDRSVEFVRPVLEADYGIVAVFKDLYENLWDLVQYT